MSFIAINAKADIRLEDKNENLSYSTEKKGKLTPSQNAQLNAWCLASKTGILNCLEKCEPTDSTYDIVNNEATIVFKKGYIVICGRLVECEQNTTVKINTLNNASGKIVLKYDLSASKEKEFSVVVKNGDLIQEDLNNNTVSGIYEFELCSFSTASNKLTVTREDKNYVPDLNGKLEQFEQGLYGEGKVLNGYDTSKGTIEKRFKDFEGRLNSLGFKKASIQVLQTGTSYIDANKTEMYSLGKIVYGTFWGKAPKTSGNWTSGTIETQEINVAIVKNSIAPNERIKILEFSQQYNAGSAQYPLYLVKKFEFYLNTGNMITVTITKTGSKGYQYSFEEKTQGQGYCRDNYQSKTFL